MMVEGVYSSRYSCSTHLHRSMSHYIRSNLHAFLQSEIYCVIVAINSYKVNIVVVATYQFACVNVHACVYSYMAKYIVSSSSPPHKFVVSIYNLHVVGHPSIACVFFLACQVNYFVIAAHQFTCIFCLRVACQINYLIIAHQFCILLTCLLHTCCQINDLILIIFFVSRVCILILCQIKEVLSKAVKYCHSNHKHMTTLTEQIFEPPGLSDCGVFDSAA